jgi:hypothetical protein
MLKRAIGKILKIVSINILFVTGYFEASFSQNLSGLIIFGIGFTATVRIKINEHLYFTLIIINFCGTDNLPRWLSLQQ